MCSFLDRIIRVLSSHQPASPWVGPGREWAFIWFPRTGQCAQASGMGSNNLYWQVFNRREMDFHQGAAQIRILSRWQEGGWLWGEQGWSSASLSMLSFTSHSHFLQRLERRKIPHFSSTWIHGERFWQPGLSQSSVNHLWWERDFPWASANARTMKGWKSLTSPDPLLWTAPGSLHGRIYAPTLRAWLENSSYWEIRVIGR